MHDTSMRLQHFGSHLFNATVVLLGILASMYHILSPKSPSLNLSITSLKPFQFRPEIDLSSEFKPGLKQIFIYAKYKTNKSEEVIWSRIIKRSDEKKIDENLTVTYRNYEAVRGELIIEGCLFPYVGMIKFKEYGRKGIFYN